MVSILLVFQLKFCTYSHFYHSCCLSRVSELHWFHSSNNICWKVQEQILAGLETFGFWGCDLALLSYSGTRRISCTMHVTLRYKDWAVSATDKFNGGRLRADLMSWSISVQPPKRVFLPLLLFLKWSSIITHHSQPSFKSPRDCFEVIWQYSESVRVRNLSVSLCSVWGRLNVPPSINIFNEQQSWFSTIGGSKPNLGTVYVRAFPCYVVPCRQKFQRGDLVFIVSEFLLNRPLP